MRGTSVRSLFARRAHGILARGESGVTLLETLVALAVLSVVSVAFLSGLATTSRAAVVADRMVAAESLAQGQMESARRATYAYEATSYTPVQIPGDESYVGFSAEVVAEPLNSPDDGVQKITVTIRRSGVDVYVLQGYKVDR